MNLIELDRYFYDLLNLKDFERTDNSQNGLQITRQNPQAEIKSVAFAVDASLESVKRAKQIGAEVLFVHHGLFWGRSHLITGGHYERIRAFLEADIALYAVHLPLDAHQTLGNNAGIAKRLGLMEIEPFGLYHGQMIGFRGKLEPITLDELVAKFFVNGGKPNCLLPFGKNRISTVGVVSGGASDEVHQAIELGLDAYITGEFLHQDYHAAYEGKINVLGCGHYQTETVGVQLVAEQLYKDCAIHSEFIDIPTGL